MQRVVGYTINILKVHLLEVVIYILMKMHGKHSIKFEIIKLRLEPVSVSASPPLQFRCLLTRTVMRSHAGMANIPRDVALRKSPLFVSPFVWLVATHAVGE